MMDSEREGAGDDGQDIEQDGGWDTGPEDEQVEELCGGLGGEQATELGGEPGGGQVVALGGEQVGVGRVNPGREPVEVMGHELGSGLEEVIRGKYVKHVEQSGEQVVEQELNRLLSRAVNLELDTTMIIPEQMTLLMRWEGG